MLIDTAMSLEAELNMLGPKRSTKGLQALGRLKAGQMNKTESKYNQYLLTRRVIGEIQWHGFEAMTFKLAPDCRLTPDFMVLSADGYLEAHDVKGSRFIVTDDAKVKMRVAASLMPVRFLYVFPQKNGGWLLKEVGA
jgi:hypothetical protein